MWLTARLKAYATNVYSEALVSHIVGPAGIIKIPVEHKSAGHHTRLLNRGFSFSSTFGMASTIFAKIGVVRLYGGATAALFGLGLRHKRTA